MAQTSGEIRERARLEMPEPLRRDVRMLGDVLGRVLVEYGGKDLLDDVEALRHAVIAARTGAGSPDTAAQLVRSWSLERAEDVARAFTVYFHLANLAEEAHRVRVLRERGGGSGRSGDSLASAVEEIRGAQGEERLGELIAGLRFHPVFTAHPTEARRRAVITSISRIAVQLDRLDDARNGDAVRADATRRLTEEVDILWRTAHLRSTSVGPLDEVRSAMAAFDETLFVVVPELYRTLDRVLIGDATGAREPAAPAFVRFGSWVGSDRDGNPSVTHDITVAAMAIQSGHIITGFEAATTRIGRTLTAQAATTPPSPQLQAKLDDAAQRWPEVTASIALRSPGEPHREFLLLAAERLAARLRDDAPPGLAYTAPAEFADDVRCLQASLVAAGAPRLAYGEVQHLLWQIETFGFHLAELEVRQHSAIHATALQEIRAGGGLSPSSVEVLETLRVMARLQREYGVDSCRRYVISFTRNAGDIAAVYELAHHATRLDGSPPPVLDVVPLFETGDDLAHATSILDEAIELPAVRERLAANGRQLEVMLGYSDSAKDIGPVAATLALYDAQAALVAWAKRHDVTLTLFHGRGGALGRGGGPANRAVLSQAPGSVDGRFKVTEQGEVVFARYGNRVIAHRHLDQVASAVLLASSPAVEQRATAAAVKHRAVVGKAAVAAKTAYQSLVESDGFAEFFARVSPLPEIGRLRIGSRPTRRSANPGLADLRAIPWNFSWSQTRATLTGWYGLGTGLEAVGDLGALRAAYEEWALFRAMLDNAEMSLAKADRDIAARHFELGNRPDLAETILTEMDRTLHWLLAVLGKERLLEDHRVLGRAVALRNPYVDALSHLQMRALEALHAGQDAGTGKAADPDETERTQRLLLLTINGVAAGLQNTG